ncbi:hypothetical protein [Pelosinus fermentans]|uniref:Uncharacterized protein n=1 Tax=Pelosinus fermentans JBW45 TaxID=1192197 RepID=I9NLG2_9FIRM|nr:hypothetical protein [Pelosinus fermentans]AJQ29640.1 hypothetical protein JBW_04309 [Pelosinus fermentans JBW45]
MAQFPNIQQPVYPFTTKIKDPSLQSEMENGLVISRAKFTRVPQNFTLKWTACRPAITRSCAIFTAVRFTAAVWPLTGIIQPLSMTHIPASCFPFGSKVKTLVSI